MNSSDTTRAPDPISALVQPGQSGELLKITLNALPDPLIVFDGGERIVFANTAATRFLEAHNLPVGEGRDDLFQSLKVFDSVSPNPLPAESLPVARALQGETVEGAEYAVRPVREGTCRWIECGSRPLAGSNGNGRGAVFIFRDITDRKKRELSLEAADQLRDYVFEGNLAGVIHTTVDGRILDCNNALVRMFGYSSKKEVLALRAQQLYFDQTERERLLLAISVSPEVREFEISFRRSDNMRCWALISVRLLDGQPGEVGGSLVSTVIDITQRKLSEETLRRSEQRFASFMQYLPGMAFIKDLNGRYVYFNNAARSQFGRDPTEIVGKTDDELWPSDEAASYRANDASVFETGEPLEIVERVPQEDGVHTWLMSKFPIVENGEVALLGGIGIDVTERRTLEEQLTQARKMEALGRLAGGVAHDFNNLLTVISGYGQLALEGFGNASATRMTSYMQEILNSARRASELTGQLLAFSRRQTIQPKVFDLCGLLQRIERLLQRMIGEHVELKVRTSAEACIIRADPHQIEQVVMNLAVNARDAMPLGGMLEIECGLLPEPIERVGLPPLGILLEVRDNGVGMDEDVKAQMFEPFFTSKDKGRGTGLGLSTVYGVVSQASGEIDVKSEPGEGSRFRIYFPVTVGDAEETPEPASGSALVGLETVLLVEDEAGVRALAETVLKKLGYRVLVADSGMAALKIWERRNKSIDVLLTDVIMPHMSGGELAHKLRETNPRLKVLFMSGYTDDMIASHGVLARETQLLPKPFTAEALGRKLRDVLDA